MLQYPSLWYVVRSKIERWLREKAKVIQMKFVDRRKYHPDIPLEDMEETWMTADANFDALLRMLYAFARKPYPNLRRVSSSRGGSWPAERLASGETEAEDAAATVQFKRFPFHDYPDVVSAVKDMPGYLRQSANGVVQGLGLHDPPELHDPPDKLKLNQIFELVSPKFVDFLETLQDDPTLGHDEEYLEDELTRQARAESYRMWARKYVEHKVTRDIDFISRVVTIDFMDAKNPDSVLSSTGLLRCISVSQMMDKAAVNAGPDCYELLRDSGGDNSVQAKELRKECLEKAIHM
eukprot:SAG11_NODE_5457_length_1554_cov_2.116838_1_plen_293_part_00